MKIVVIGSGMSGLTAAAVCAQAGHHVEVFEQNERPGGVTRTLAADGYQWDLGQLLLEGLAPHEPAGRILNELGISPLISIQKDDRGYVFPDFELRKPEQPAGMRWRMDKLREIFPKEALGLERYWKEYIRFNRVMTAGRRIDTARGFDKLLWQARLYWHLLPLLAKKDWSAQRLMDSFFKPIELQCVFISILADFFTSPRQFMGLGVYALNPEPVYDCRLPDKLAPGAELLYNYSIHGGIEKLVEAFTARIQDCGGKIYTRRAVSKILVENNKITGVLGAQGVQTDADVVIASGGAQETFLESGGSGAPATPIQSGYEASISDGFSLHGSPGCGLRSSSPVPRQLHLFLRQLRPGRGHWENQAGPFSRWAGRLCDPFTHKPYPLNGA